MVGRCAVVLGPGLFASPMRAPSVQLWEVLSSSSTAGGGAPWAVVGVGELLGDEADVGAAGLGRGSL